MTYDAVIGRELAGLATSLALVADRHWTCTLANGGAIAVEARADDAWLTLAARPALAPGLPPITEGTLLAWNATLVGGARFGLGPGLALHADVPLDGGVDLGRRIAEACADFRTASAYLHGAGVGPAPLGIATPGVDLSALCRETGWTAKECGVGRVAVDLEVPGSFHRAVVEPRDGGGVAASVPLLDAALAGTAPASGTCERAVALFLVRLGAVVRMARATPSGGGTASPHLEVVRHAPGPGELAHAFAALSVACRLAATEVMVLRHDEAVASAYVRQWDATAVRCAA